MSISLDADTLEGLCEESKLYFERRDDSDAGGLESISETLS